MWQLKNNYISARVERATAALGEQLENQSRAYDMAEPPNEELDAFLAFFSTFNLHRSITTVADLSDGAGLLEILSIMCDDSPSLHDPSDL